MSGSDLFIDNLTGITSIDLTAGNTAYFYGTTQAPTITVTSFDIFTADFAFLGVYGVTDLLTLNAVNSNGVYIGDFGELPGGVYYDEGEGEVQAANIVINALASDEGGAPDIYIGDVEIQGTDVAAQAGAGAPTTQSQSRSGTASVTVNTAGSILVSGAVEYYDAAATDTLTLNAGEDIIVDTDTGAIEMYSGTEGSRIRCRAT